MCGIVGVLDFDGKPVDVALLTAMRESMAHRGPDDSGLFINPARDLGLGFRRLSILDISAAGHQPMGAAHGRFAIVFNGEIYNFLELRKELETQGSVFVSRSDTEVLLELYAKQGPAMLGKLRGMFAFAIWDEREKSLFLARDRVGKKPLYWTKVGNIFIFASEIKAIVRHPAVPRRVDEEALYHYLSFYAVPAPKTLFADIFKLPCGHMMKLSKHGAVKVEEYWDPIDAAKPQIVKDPRELSQGVLERLRESIRYRMISDVPFGVFLSGGLDSTANVALMSGLMDRPVQTFSVGYDDHKRYSELAWARRVAKEYKTDHHEVILTDKDFVSFLPELIFHQDEPIADPVRVPVHAVSKLARQHGVTVCQVGEGSDELFCGYPSWLEMRRLYDLQGSSLLRMAARAVLPAIEAGANAIGRGFWRMERYRRMARGEEIFWTGSEAFSETAKRRLLSARMREKFKDHSSFEVIEPYLKRFKERSHFQDPLQWMAYIDLKIRLPDILLMRVDKMSMANSVETRAPFLDHRFIEFVLGIDPSLRTPGGVTKGLLKQSLRGVVANDIIDRPKQGFAVPVNEWFWQALGPAARDAMDSLARDSDQFDAGQLRLWTERGNVLSWVLMNYALWHKRWIAS